MRCGDGGGGGVEAANSAGRQRVPACYHEVRSDVWMTACCEALEVRVELAGVVGTGGTHIAEGREEVSMRQQVCMALRTMAS